MVVVVVVSCNICENVMVSVVLEVDWLMVEINYVVIFLGYGLFYYYVWNVFFYFGFVDDVVFVVF